VLSDHGVAAEIRDEVKPAIEVLRVVEEVLPDDLGVGMG